MLILGIESSCDDAAIALVNSDRQIIVNEVISDLAEHHLFGGVVPEIASRNHLLYLPKALKLVEDYLDKIDAVAVTYGPGLIGGLIVGVMIAKSLAYARGLPLIPINHLEGHLFTNRLVDPGLKFPFLTLLVSGGHCQFVVVYGVGRYKVIGQTLDDAVGEAFDKVARMMGLQYPGGPKIEKLAKNGDPHAYNFPLPLLKQNNCDLSFSGLKTAVKRTIDKVELTDNVIADIAASFQFTVAKILKNKLKKALSIARQDGCRSVNICGGVSANQYICKELRQTAAEMDCDFFHAPLSLCTDNAAMIAWAAIEHLNAGTDKNPINNLKKYLQNFNFAPRSKIIF